MCGGRPVSIVTQPTPVLRAGAAAAAATTPLDVVKTIMMCNASSKPTIVSAARGILAEGRGLRPIFRGVGPRALSNGLNSAIFFCFFEAKRQVSLRLWQGGAAGMPWCGQLASCQLGDGSVAVVAANFSCSRGSSRGFRGRLRRCPC